MTDHQWGPPTTTTTTPAPAPRRKGRIRRWFAIGAAVFAGLMIVGVIAQLVAPVEDPPEQVFGAVPSTTAPPTVPEPTTAPTAAPTTEAVPPTTVTPPTTEAPEPTAPPVDPEQEYVAWFTTGQSDDFEDAIDAMQCATDAIDVFDIEEAAACSYEAADLFGEIAADSAELGNPSDLAFLTEQAMSLCSNAYAGAGDALLSYDAERIGPAGQEIVRCADAMDEVTAHLDTL
jgi:hypothetical protein